MAGVMAKIDLSSQSLKSIVEDPDHVQYIPCHIDFDGEVNLQKYFSPKKVKNEDENHKEEDLLASFRGYPFCGKQMTVPENFVGVIAKESISVKSEGEVAEEDSDAVCPTVKNLKGVCAFKKFTYWNWDRKPSHADKYQQALSWLEVSEVTSTLNLKNKVLQTSTLNLKNKVLQTSTLNLKNKVLQTSTLNLKNKVLQTSTLNLKNKVLQTSTLNLKNKVLQTSTLNLKNKVLQTSTLNPNNFKTST
ncbi:Ribonuclease H2 subunit C [Trinorchestia longiramus]|nr:Ribonuclease H2 subunit C [Trinorchestia longiramus]